MKKNALLTVVFSLVLLHLLSSPVLADAAAAAARHVDDFSKDEPMETITDLPRKARLALFNAQEYHCLL